MATCCRSLYVYIHKRSVSFFIINEQLLTSRSTQANPIIHLVQSRNSLSSLEEKLIFNTHIFIFRCIPKIERGGGEQRARRSNGGAGRGLEEINH